jgi:APA family basic amino acid/polyamine antiporter
MLLALSGTYEQLFRYSIFSSILFHVITGLALFRLRQKRPDVPRPYRVVGYPFVPALFVAVMTGLVLNTLYERPVQSLLGIGLVALGVPFFLWRRRDESSSGVEAAYNCRPR